MKLRCNLFYRGTRQEGFGCLLHENGLLFSFEANLFKVYVIFSLSSDRFNSNFILEVLGRRGRAASF